VVSSLSQHIAVFLKVKQSPKVPVSNIQMTNVPIIECFRLCGIFFIDAKVYGRTPGRV